MPTDVYFKGVVRCECCNCIFFDEDYVPQDVVRNGAFVKRNTCPECKNRA
jgi:hypothetical protein